VLGDAVRVQRATEHHGVGGATFAHKGESRDLAAAAPDLARHDLERAGRSRMPIAHVPPSRPMTTGSLEDLELVAGAPTTTPGHKEVVIDARDTHGLVAVRRQERVCDAAHDCGGSMISPSRSVSNYARDVNRVPLG
jgi:hypothetical protein